MELVMKRLRGIAILVMRRIRGFKQEEAAAEIGVPSNKDVSALEHGVGATSEILDTCASRLGFDFIHQARLLECLQFLERPVEPPSRHPYEITTPETLALVAQSWDVARLALGWKSSQLREEKHSQDRELALAQWERLAKCEHHQRLAFVEMAAEFRSWALGQLLITKSREAAAMDAGIARELGELAVAVAYQVGSCRLLSHAYGVLGNAYRVAGDLDLADARLARAESLWSAADDDGGLLDPGRLGSFTASLRRDQRRFPEALEVLDRVLPVSHEPGRTLYLKATIFEYAGDYLAALQTLDRAEEFLLRGQPDLRDELMVLHERGACLCHLGRYAEAQPVAVAASERAGRIANHLDELRAMWLQARVSSGLGDTAHALSTFERVREEFATLNLDYDLALVSLEIAELLLRLRRLAEAQALGFDLTAVFASRRIHREALASLRVACEALRTRSATVELIRKAVSDLYRGRGLR